MSKQQVSPRTLTFVCVFAIALSAYQALGIAAAPMDALARSDNDDILRFLQLKAWLSGQGWFDGRLYQMLAPAGLDLHWSRYVDLGIVLILWPLAQVLPFEQAAGVALIVWPLGLFALLVVLTAQTARKTLGVGTGILAVLALVLWVPTGHAYFPAARIDHHNVQILLTTGLVFTLILPGSPVRLGIMGGVLAALSLAVGLELLFTIAVAGIVLALRAIWRRGDAEDQFLAFVMSMAVAAPLFFAGQTAPAAWIVPRCDVLSLPYLALTTLGAGSALIYRAAAPKLNSASARFGVLLALFGGGIAVVLPLLSPCIEGPYGVLPQDVQDIIFGAIAEARPAWPQLFKGDDLTFFYVVPALVATVLGSVVWLVKWRTGKGDEAETRMLGTLLIFAWLGLVATSGQLRLILAGAAAYPLLMGYCLAKLLALRETWRMPATAGFLVTAALTLFAPNLVTLGLPSAEADVKATKARNADTCRDPEMLRSLRAVPQGRILAAANISAPMMLLTDHIALTGPYHRSPAAMADGLIPFTRDEANLRAAIERTQADYLLLCRDAVFWKEASFATALAHGQEADGFAPVPGLHEDLVLLAVTRE